MSIAIGAGQGTATAAAVLCGPPAHRANVALMPITPAEAIRSPGRTPLTPSTARLAGARLTRPTIPSRPNPHSARGTGLPHNSRVPSLEPFGRRPGACRAVAMGRHPKPFTKVRFPDAVKWRQHRPQKLPTLLWRNPSVEPTSVYGFTTRTRSRPG